MKKCKVSSIVAKVAAIALLAAMALGLAACSASGDNATSARAKFVGSWKVTAWDWMGFWTADEKEEGILDIADDGTGTITFHFIQDGLEKQTIPFTWELESSNSIIATYDQPPQYMSYPKLRISWDDDVLTTHLEARGKITNYHFTKDGTYGKAPFITMDGTEDITSPDELVGSWELIGFGNYNGEGTLYGESTAIQQWIGGGIASATFASDGTGSVNGSPMTWKIRDNGATVTPDTPSVKNFSFTVKKKDGHLYIDYSEAMGEEGIFVLGKEGEGSAVSAEQVAAYKARDYYNAKYHINEGSAKPATRREYQSEVPIVGIQDVGHGEDGLYVYDGTQYTMGDGAVVFYDASTQEFKDNEGTPPMKSMSTFYLNGLVEDIPDSVLPLQIFVVNNGYVNGIEYWPDCPDGYLPTPLAQARPHIMFRTTELSKSPKPNGYGKLDFRVVLDGVRGDGTGGLNAVIGKVFSQWKALENRAVDYVGCIQRGGDGRLTFNAVFKEESYDAVVEQLRSLAKVSTFDNVCCLFVSGDDKLSWDNEPFLDTTQNGTSAQGSFSSKNIKRIVKFSASDGQLQVEEVDVGSVKAS